MEDVKRHSLSDFHIHRDGHPTAARQRTSSAAQQAPSLEAVRIALAAMPNSDGAYGYDEWIAIGIALRNCRPDDEAYELWVEWSRQSSICGKQHQPEDKWETFPTDAVSGWGTIEIEAKRRGGEGLAAAAFDDGSELFNEPIVAPGGVRTLDNMWAYVPNGTFIDLVTGKPWTDKAALNNIIQGVPGKNKAGKDIMVPASDVLQRTKPVHQMSWMPGRPQIVRDMIVRESGGGSIDRCSGNNIWNQYRPPLVKPGKAERAGFWVDHMRKLYPLEWQHILVWMAHRVQRPWEKLNHALVLGGAQGIGKDFILKPLRAGVGEDNWQSIDPPELLGAFNGWRQAVVLVINEIHNLGENLNPYRFFEQTKTLLLVNLNELKRERFGRLLANHFD